jgi:hypothetical protein
MPRIAGEPKTRLDKVLAYVPQFLASHLHVLWLLGLGAYLIVLPLAGVDVSSKAELIGGNYTNVTSDIGACIAAGGTLHLVRQARKRGKTEAATHRIMADLWEHHTGTVHPDAPRPDGEANKTG